MAANPRIGTMIRRARERKRMSQEDLARLLGVSRSAVNAWERDRAYPRNSIGALEEILGISLDGGQGEREPQTEWERWERWVLTNPRLDADVARAIVKDANDARDAHFAAGRTASASPSAPTRPASPAARTAGRHRAAE